MAEGTRYRPGNRKLAIKGKIFGIIFLPLLVVAGFCPLDEKLSLVLFGLIVLIMLLAAVFTRQAEKPQAALSIENLVHLAQFSAGMGQCDKAQRYYCRAIYRMVSTGDVDKAAGLFEEYFIYCRRVFAPRIQLEICRELCRVGKNLMAARSLEKLIKEWPRQFHHCDPRLLEQAYVHLARIYAEKLELPDLASHCYFDLLEKFPRSAYRETALFQLQVLDLGIRLAV